MKYSLAEHKIITKGDYWIAPNATVIGKVVLGNNVSIWFNVVLRGPDPVSHLPLPLGPAWSIDVDPESLL